MSVRHKADFGVLGRSALLASWVAASAAACGDPAVESARGAVFEDSLGVEIVTTAQPLWTENEAWTVSDQATLTIGEAVGDDTQSLFDVGDVRRLSDGRVAIVNSGTRQIRVYGPDGEHVADLGREGEGPGEFRRPRRLWLGPRDSLVVFDGRAQRLTVFSPELTFARTMSVTNRGSANQSFVAWRFDDGRFLVEGLVPSPTRPRLGRFPSGMSAFGVSTSDADHITPVVEFERGDEWGYTSGSGGLSYTSFPFSLNYPPRAGGSETFFIASGLEASIEQRRPDGEVIRIVRWTADPASVDESVQARYKEWWLSLSEDENFRREARSMLADLEFPEQLPMFASMLTDSEDYLWVERYRPPWEEDRTWWIFSPDGAWLGELPLPEGFDLRDVGSDYILGVRRDNFGVERVVMYSLERPGTG